MADSTVGRGLGGALLLLVAGCASEPAARIEEPRQPVEARAMVDRAVATTGDVITYRITVDADAALEVRVPEPGAEIAGFRIIDIGREPDRERDGRRIEERWYRLRADLVGSYVLPPLAVEYRLRGEGDEAQAPFDTVETSAIFVEVESVLPAGGQAEDIRDIKPLRRVGGAPSWWWLGAAAAVLAAAAAMAWRLRRRRDERSEPLAPPHEIAFAALDALRGTDFQDPAAVRRFHFAISETIRAYVEGRFGLNATDLTTEEILAGLGGLEGLGAEQGASLERFLIDTDRVKFAEHMPSSGEIEATYERALGFVEQTRPAAESEAESELEPRAEAA